MGPGGRDIDDYALLDFNMIVRTQLTFGSAAAEMSPLSGNGSCSVCSAGASYGADGAQRSVADTRHKARPSLPARRRRRRCAPPPGTTRSARGPGTARRPEPP